MKRKCLLILEAVLLTSKVSSNPIKTPEDDDYDVADPDAYIKYCQLPLELDEGGTSKFLEDCDSLSRFTIPIPATNEQQYGVHPVICCPKTIGDSPVCFPTDPWCPSFVKPGDRGNTDVNRLSGADVDTEEELDERVVSEDDYYSEEFPLLPIELEILMSNAESNCAAVPFNSTCTPVSRCSLGEEVTPTLMIPCSFDEGSSQLMICCPVEAIVDRPMETPQPRFPMNGKARECEDKTPLCRRWNENGACALDKTFITSEISPGNSFVTSVEMFQLMSQTCMEACGRCGDKGCVDEHPNCPEWARQGFCVYNPFIMVHTCRESCGVCGFLSPLNTEPQESGGNSYSNFKDPSFDCGRQKNLKDLEDEGIEVFTPEPDVEKSTVATRSGPKATADADEFDVRCTGNCSLPDSDSDAISDPDADFDDDISEVSFGNSNKDAKIRCGVTLIADRWMITAAHCYDIIDGSASSIRANTIRTLVPSATELVETKNVYIHPNYNFGSLYSDIALLELGRRVLFDFEKVGDTPACLDPGVKLDGKVVLVQGYGVTETGEQGQLLEANTTLLNVRDCMVELSDYLETRPNKRRAFCESFEYGITREQICGKGFKTEDGFISGSCKGDSGGPVLLKKDGKETLVGIVSGSLSCSSKAPEWFTRFAYFRQWIDCIISSSAANNFSKEKVEELCRDAARPANSGPRLGFC